MSIPRIIHYCWFGRNPKPKLAQRCIKSWKRFCPDYQIIEWNEDNFDVSTAPLYVRQAYEAGRWAFVTDYVRLKALTEIGGIYMDTDVEVVKPLDPFLEQEAFAGFENDACVQTGVMACQKGFPLFVELMEYYNEISFLHSDGTENITTNVRVLSDICIGRGMVPNGEYQIIAGLAIYPKPVFCPINFDTKKLKKTKKTVTIHWFAGSWHTEEELLELQKERRRLQKEKLSSIRYNIGKKLFGEHGYEKLKSAIRKR